jgi:hypothetical protein
MSKRLLVILLVQIILGALFSSSVLAGPPWPAEVIHVKEGVFCDFPWVNSNYEVITLSGGPGIWVAQYHSGQLQWNCHTSIDFNDPTLLSLDELCAMAPDFCRGNGSFMWKDIPCYGDGDLLANDSQMIVTPNGNVNIGCRFNLNYP